MNDEKENEVINRWLSGDLSYDEAKETLPENDLKAYRQIIDEMDRWEIAEGDEVFDASEITTKTKTTGKAKVRRLNIGTYLSIAASVMILLAAGIAIFSYIGDTSYVADEGKFIDVELPDGDSHVVLSPGSRISWARSDWNDEGRKMKLEGKAFFTVRRGSPFVVNGENGTVEVLGTEFEMSSFDESFIVACYLGKVKATALNDEITVLTAGQENHFHKGSWNGVIDANGSSPTWIKSQLFFHETPLREVIAKLEKTYDLRVDHTRVDINQLFTGSIPTNNMKVALESVFPVFNMKYSIEGKSLILEKD